MALDGNDSIQLIGLLMMGLKTTVKSKLLDAMENLLHLRSNIHKDYEPWYRALMLVKEMKIDEAALLVAKSCKDGFLDDSLKRIVLDEISSLAVLNDVDGPGIESMWSTAADHGYLDLAYNAGNQILWRKANKTVDDYKVASRYFQMAIERSSKDSIKYSAVTNYAEIVRDGLISGSKDWLGAVALYEEAGDKGLLNAMLNAGNVLLWLVESGDSSYSHRAAAWFERIITHVESGQNYLDLGGHEEAVEKLKIAKIRLVGMHLDGFLGEPDLEQCQKLLDTYVGDEMASNMFGRLSSLKLIEQVSLLSSSDNNSWAKLFSAAGWSFTWDSFDFGLISGIKASGRLFYIETSGKFEMTILAFDYFTHSSVDHEEMYKKIALEMSVQSGKPIFVVGKKAFFLKVQERMFDAINVMVNGNLEFVPIWPGATSDQVYQTLNDPFEFRFIPGRDDPNNTIPRIVNAIDEGITIENGRLPNAISIMVDKILAMPIHRPDEPARIGLPVTQTVDELRRAFQANASGKS